MSKFIIHNKAEPEVDDKLALTLVLHVVNAGRISNYGKQYCYATSFRNSKVHVLASKTKSGTDTFTILKASNDKE